MPRLRALPSVVGPVAALALLVGVGSAQGDQVKPPGPTGCGEGLTASSKDPEAQLPSTGVFLPATARVRLIVGHPTQTTRVTLRAYLLGSGRRADAYKSGEYTCTVPGPWNTIAFPVKPGTVGSAIRRHGMVKLRVSFQMVNANGRRHTLLRVITVTREPGTTDGLG